MPELKASLKRERRTGDVGGIYPKLNSLQYVHPNAFLLNRPQTLTHSCTVAGQAVADAADVVLHGVAGCSMMGAGLEVVPIMGRREDHRVQPGKN